ncbi:Multifunctional cyclase-dehydratase-3-O-methyl transferase TcmN [Micromonospora sp. MW-13]|uniref:methyltransferase n=1 Tax=Micromonospora sp. MW-13 TaxID=2094022 RepID=UPI000ED32AAE|nr:methyltransferase [Micromonospora sp. MW-13]RGC66973.1 Multifunctional cyclase-dehydratase-3-O-methyl transferase TcmN [Micromonospora sp. MW-13]
MEVPPDPSHTERLVALLRGHAVTQLVAAAARFRIPDVLAEDALPVADIGARTGIPVPALDRYLPALAGLDIVQREPDGTYRVAPLGRLLRCEPGSLYGQALMAGDEYYGAWQELDHALLTGESAFHARHGCGLWEMTARKPDLAVAFARTMRWNSNRVLSDVLALHDFTDARLVVDLGAGDATLLCGVLARYPGVRGLAVEQGSMAARAAATVEEAGLNQRCGVQTGDIRRTVPSGGDVYILKSVIHNWPDEAATDILRNVRDAMPAGSRLLLVENAHDGTDPEAALRDLAMMVLFGSRDRTPAEYCALLTRAGFAASTPRRSSSGMCLIPATADKP